MSAHRTRRKVAAASSSDIRATALRLSVLAAAEIDGFLANLPLFYESADLEGQVWRNFVDAWLEEFHESECSTGDLFPIAQKIDGFDFGRGRDQAQKTSFGMQLSKKRDCVVGEYRIMKTSNHRRTNKWRLASINSVFSTTLFAAPDDETEDF